MGKLNCLDCGIQLKSYYTKRCRSCEGKRRWLEGIWSEETKHKIAKTLTGRKQSEETKEKRRKKLSGSNNYNWKGGKHTNILGYIVVNLGGDKKQYEHRMVMEQHLKRKLRYWELIHHKNGNKADNRIENLKILTRQNHAIFHQLGTKKSLEI